MSGAGRPAGMQRIGAAARLIGVAGLLGAALTIPGFARASTSGPIIGDCAPPLPLEKVVVSADLVFVGTVNSVDNGGQTANVTVTEVWRGDVTALAVINGGQDPASQAPDVRLFNAGATYLFVPTKVNGSLVDSSCSSTVQWSDDLARLRPPDAHPPSASVPVRPGPLAFLGAFAGPLVMAGLIGGGAFGFALLVARRRDS